MQKIHPEIIRRFGRDPRIIFERDKWKCLVCGSIDDLTVDHIDGNGRHSKKPNNDLTNLRTLCRRCHGKNDQNRRWKTSHARDAVCLQCSKEFKVSLWQLKAGKGKYCTVKCHNDSMRK